MIHIALGRLQGRIFLWRAAWPMFEAHPFFGSGWATFQLRFPELQAKFIAVHPELAGYWTHTAQLHNDLLQILYEAGAIGFVAFLWLLWRYARSLRRAASENRTASATWLKASTGGITALLVNSLFNLQFAIPPTLILLFTLLAFPSLLRPSESEPFTLQSMKSPSTRIRLTRALATCLVIALALWCGFNIKNRVSSDRALALGLEDERRGEYVSAEAQFRGGLRMSPQDGRLHYGLARALFVQAHHAEALAHVLRARQTVADAHLEVLRARIIDQLGNGSLALEAYRYALWLNPQLKSVPADIERLSGTSR